MMGQLPQKYPRARQTYAAFGKITKDVWTKAEEHVVKIEKEYCKENCIDRSVIEPIIIDFCDDDSDDYTG